MPPPSSGSAQASPASSTPASLRPSEDISRSSTPAGAITPNSALGEKMPDDSSKLKTFVGILKKFIGVTDIANVRFSLPAQLLEPIPNLEYWHYLDRPEAFAAIGDSEDELGRMLGALRFWFTKDLKYVKGKPCKPYNSTLGEFFRCQWQVEDAAPSLKGPDDKTNPATGSSTKGQNITINYLTEQTSHHPPVSAFYVECPEKGITAKGFDQLSAKFTGTSIRVIPGNFNLGIFVTLHKHNDEEYQMTHPAAYLGGFLRGNLNVTVADTCFVSCRKTGIKVILHYLEEGWLGKTQNKVEGVVYKCDVDKDNTTRIKDVPDKAVIGRIEGAWTDKVYFVKGNAPFSKASDKDKILLIDVNPLYPVPKIVPPGEHQLPNESRKFWSGVTEAIVNKQFSQATSTKQELEERQRTKAADRKARNVEWKPRFFTAATDPPGKPELTDEGRLALDKMHQGDYFLTPSDETGA